MTDYTELLKKSRKDIPTPELLPVGTWRLRTQRAQFFEPRDEGQNPRAVVYLKAIEPLDNVDPDELSELPDDYDYGNTPLEYAFFLGELRDWDKLNKFFDLLGIDDTLTTEQALKAVGGQEVLAYVDQDTYTSKQTNQPETKNSPKSFQPTDD